MLTRLRLRLRSLPRVASALSFCCAVALLPACSARDDLRLDLQQGDIGPRLDECDDLDDLPLPLVGTAASRRVYCFSEPRLTLDGTRYPVCRGSASVLFPLRDPDLRAAALEAERLERRCTVCARYTHQFESGHRIGTAVGLYCPHDEDRRLP